MLLCCLAITQGAWAEDVNTIAFQETFNTNNTQGGRDGKYTNLGTGIIHYDNTGWTGDDNSKIYSAYQCLRFGTGSANGICTTPTITLTGTTYALLTFSAAGWGDTAQNKLAVTANEGVTLSGDTDITLVNEEWSDYTVVITLTTASTVQLTFTGKRGLLDDVVVRNIITVPAPTLPDAYTFWPNTTEINASQDIALTHDNYTIAYYTTDGSTPSKSNGTPSTIDSNISINGTTTVKAIAYVGDLASTEISKTYTQGSTVTGLTAFKALAEGTEARLLLTSESNTRITFANSQQAYLRDDNGVLCIDFGITTTPNPTPATQQHVAGWIVGKKQTINGRPTLVATSNTNTHYLALAERRNEAMVAPVAITADVLNDNIGNWVTVSELPIINTENIFALTTAQPYTGAIVDVTGIVTATNAIAPTDAVTFVIDEEKAFVSPASDISNATVRLKRTLKADQWNTFCIPMNLPITGDMEGNYYQYTGVNGGAMVFSKSASIEAGIPYIVKPNANIVDKLFTGITLSAAPAQTILLTGSENAFVGTYSPVVLKTDKTEQFLTATGKLGYPSSSATATMKGMRAYFHVPSGELTRIAIDGEETSIDNAAINQQPIVNGPYFDLQGRKVSKPNKGIYISNGRKVVIQ